MVADRRRSEFEATLLRSAEARRQEAGAALVRASLWRDAFHRFVRNRAAVASGIAFLVMLLYVIIVPLVSSADPYAVAFDQAYKSPSWSHPFGTDSFGRDLFVRTALGGRVSIEIGFAATLAIMLIGVIYGAVAGFLSGSRQQARRQRLVPLLRQRGHITQNSGDAVFAGIAGQRNGIEAAGAHG